MTDRWDSFLFFGGKMPSLLDGRPKVPYPIGYKQIAVKQISRAYKIKVRRVAIS